MFKILHKNIGDLALTEQYKTYLNALNQLLTQSKQNYYHKILNENESNSRMIYSVVNDLINHKRRNNTVHLKLKASLQ